METKYNFDILFEKLKEEKEELDSLYSISFQDIQNINENIQTLKEYCSDESSNSQITYTRS